MGLQGVVLIALLLAPAPKAPPGHDLHGATCVYGTFTQKGSHVDISNAHWTASGFIRGDLLFLDWSYPRTGSAHRSVYRIDGSKLVGHWGFAGKCFYTESDICGEIHREEIEIARPE